MNVSRVVQRIVVVCCTLGIFLLPTITSEGSVWILAIIGACVVYYGFHQAHVALGIAALLLTELLYGFDAGVFSISFILSVWIIRFVLRFISVTPWSQKDGWSPLDAGVSMLVAWILIALTQVIAVVVGDALYGYGFLSLRLETLGYTTLDVSSLILILVTQVLVRRMSVPFKREILFGS